ncbi:hypothetical protein BXY58_2074 [Epilithonimonas arachidiradicis]|uniref:Uncharacterized protein n=1 Tax=Epilithonimonas arachidiradicis TaxID=1617282 RepID=A0A420D987_9FLAO|nr:hypothetical protein BXY58_2074 [Epilithonimonas arachidiradicis]
MSSLSGYDLNHNAIKKIRAYFNKINFPDYSYSDLNGDLNIHFRFLSGNNWITDVF